MMAILDFDRDNNVCSSRKETSYGFPYAVTVVFDFRSTTYRMSYSELIAYLPLNHWTIWRHENFAGMFVAGYDNLKRSKISTPNFLF
jgi:hypothetical protein